MAVALGTHLIVEVPKLSKKSKGGIILSEDTLNRETQALNVGKIKSMGEHCFSNYQIKPNVGDLVFFIAYAGDRIPTTKDHNIRLIYDEHCRGIVEPGDLDGMEIDFEQDLEKLAAKS
jgi:co-chaperonin GroES (HSP10)